VSKGRVDDAVSPPTNYDAPSINMDIKDQYEVNQKSNGSTCAKKVALITASVALLKTGTDIKVPRIAGDQSTRAGILHMV
jgi:hypothetical protein